MAGDKVLITGSAGYLGSIITELLVSQGYEVWALDNLMYFQTPHFNLFHKRNFRFIYGDVTNEKFMKDLLGKERFDFIIPLAAIVGFPSSELKPELTWMVNKGAINTIIKYQGDAKIIFPSTNSGYGVTESKRLYTEEDELYPISTYAKSKVAAERSLREAGNCVCFRFATLFGFSPRMRTDLLVNNFVYKAVNEGVLVIYERKFKRNFLHLRDAANAFLWTMRNWERMKNNIYNVGHPDYNISKEELALKIKEKVDFKIIFDDFTEDLDKRNYIISNEKILSTGFKFNYSLDDGIEELVRGYIALRDYRFRNY